MYVIVYGVIILIVIACIIPMSSALFAALGIIFGVIAVIAIAKRNFEMSKKCNKGYAEDMLIIQNVKEGGVIKIANLEGYDSDVDLKVVGRNLYMEGDYSWYELECVRNDGEKVWVDVDNDDDLVVSVVLKKLKMSEVHLSSSLEVIDEEETGSVKYDGAKFFYEDSGDATFYKYCDDKHKEKLYYWDFKSGDFLVSVERWKNENGVSDTLAYYSQIVRPAAITVYSIGGEGK